MQLIPVLTHSRVQSLQGLASLLIFLLFLFTPLSWAQKHDMSKMPDMSGANHSDMHAPAVPEDLQTVAKRLADKRESEFNHHLVGLFVLFAGTFILAQERLGKRWALARYVWPMCFLSAGLFLLVFSDTEIWPFGPQTPWYAITHSPKGTRALQGTLDSLVLSDNWCRGRHPAVISRSQRRHGSASSHGDDGTHSAAASLVCHDRPGSRNDQVVS